VNPFDRTIRGKGGYLGLGRIENQGKVKIAIDPVIAPSAGAERNNSQRMGSFNQAAHHFMHSFLRD